jgi:hypothetical protein
MADKVNPSAVIRVTLTLDDNSTLKREWMVSDIRRDGMPGWLEEGVPDWLTDARRSTNLEEPITFTGKVRPGWEDVARAVVAA